MACVLGFTPQGLLPARGRGMIRLQRAAVLALFLLLGAPLAVAGSAASGYLLSLATRAAVLAIAAVSLQFMVGFGGLVSFGHAAMLGIGAYALLIWRDGADDAAVSLPVAMAAAALLRAGHRAGRAAHAAASTFLMITLAFGQMAYFVAGSLAAYGGDDGMALDARSPLAGSRAAGGPRRAALRRGASLLLLGARAARAWLGLSRFGRALRAARENPVARRRARLRRAPAPAGRLYGRRRRRRARRVWLSPTTRVRQPGDPGLARLRRAAGHGDPGQRRPLGRSMTALSARRPGLG